MFQKRLFKYLPMSSNIYPVQCTAGAIPYRNEKGEISMKNVKVSRYVAGKAPEFLNMEVGDDYHDDDQQNYDEIAPELIRDAFPDRTLIALKKGENDDDNDNDDDDNNEIDDEMNERDLEDRRIQRLIKGHRRFDEVEMLDDSESEKEEEDKVARHLRERQAELQKEGEGSDEEEVDEEDDEELRRRRSLLKQKALENEGEVVEIIEDDEEEEEEEVAFSEEEESESDYEREPKLKPVFVRAAARHTIHKTKEQIVKEQEKERLRVKHEEEMVKQTRKMIEKINKEEAEEKVMVHACDGVSSDVEDESEVYEAWKMRELKRKKREREEKEQIGKAKEEVQRVRGMTEEQRLQEFKMNPKNIVNQQPKGKFKFMQKYYHRGAFYVQDMEDEVFKRDITAPTLEDNFNVENLPLIKQVKNFGRAGRTKYTHLVDQDTTDFDSGWANSNSTLKFYNSRGGGMKQVFEKPSSTKHKK